MAKKTKKAAPQSRETASIKSFLDMIAPSVVKFEPDHFICGNTFRCVWALREYPTQTDEQAILRHLGEKDGITLRIYTRQVTPAEEKRIIQNAANKNRMGSSNTNDLQQTITAESNLQDVASLVASMHRNREPLLHCAVYIELTASDYNTLKLLQTDVLTELVRSKLNVDRLLLRQQQGFCCASPVGYNAFGQQFERVLPASSVANLYPFNYSGKTDAKGFYVGRDKYGSNILVDFDQRDEDKTSANILILGNSGQGKSYLMKLLILNLLESGKSVITLDAEHEQQEMCEAVGGCFADLMAGKYIINVLEPKCWDDGGDPDDTAAPEAFRKSTLLAQHVSFLKDFFRAYKDFSDAHIDTIEIMVSKLYAKWGITERTNFRRMRSEDYPILSDLYDLIEEEFKSYDPNAHLLYTEKLLQEVLLGLHSMCKGADAQFFNGHTNITSSRFLVFGVKGMLSAAKNVRNAMLFNVLSFMSDTFEMKDYQAVIVYSNPPVLPIAAILANRLFKTKIIFVSYDVYPEVAYASGSLREGSTVSSVMQRINRSLFQRAESVVALTDEMREYLLDHRPELSAERVVTISNWAHEATAGSKSAARVELGYTDEDFIVAYFGNIGICQDETALIQAMDQLADHTNIKFLIAGHGNKMPSVRQAAERLPNVRICDFLTGAAFEHAVAASSCGIVSLEQGLTGMCAPSKYYSYLQGGLPILAVAEQSSYLSKEALHSEIGLCSDVGNGAQLAQNILQLYDVGGSPESAGGKYIVKENDIDGLAEQIYKLTEREAVELSV